MDQWIMILAEEIEDEGSQNEDIFHQKCVFNIFGLTYEEHEELAEFFDNNPVCSYEDTRDGRFVLRVLRNSREAVITQLASRGYCLMGEAVERPLPPNARSRAWVYHLAREDCNLDRSHEDNTSRVEEAGQQQVEEEEGNVDKSDDSESENDCQMKECKVTKKDDSVSLIQVVVKKGLK